MCASPKAIMKPEQLEPSSSSASTLALSNIEEGMGHHVERAQELQGELAQRRASLHQDLAKTQALQGKEALLTNIIGRGDGSSDTGIGPVTFTLATG